MEDLVDIKFPSKDSSFSDEEDFDAEMEIAEVFGSLPWKEKSSIETKVSEAKEKSPKQSGDQQETVIPQKTLAEQDNARDLVTTSISSSSGFSSAPSLGYGSLSATEFGITPATTPVSLFGGNYVCRNDPVPLSRTSHVSGFGCSNEAIARLSGRPRSGRGRRGAGSERRQGGSNRSDSSRDPRSGDYKNDSFSTSPSDGSRKAAVGSKISNNNNAQYAFNPFTAPPPCAQSETKGKQKTKAEPRVLGGRRPNAFADDTITDETPCKRRRVTCNICSKNGHTAEDCFRNPKNQQNREVIRCYNCFQKGHMAIRCTKPPGGGRSGQKSRKPSKNGRKEPKSEKETEKEKAAAAINMKGLEVIMKLMKDKHLRSETAKQSPQLFDDMMTYMLSQVSLNAASK